MACYDFLLYSESSSDSSFMDSEGEMELSSTRNELDVSRQIDLRSKIVKVKGGTTKKFIMTEECVRKKTPKRSGHFDVSDSIDSEIESGMDLTEPMPPTIASVQSEIIVFQNKEHNPIDGEQESAHQIGVNVGDENDSNQTQPNDITQHVASNESTENDVIYVDSNLRPNSDSSHDQSSSTGSSENSTRSECNDASESDIESQMDTSEPMDPTVTDGQVENVVLQNNENNSIDGEQVSTYPIDENVDCEIAGNQATEDTANEFGGESLTAAARNAMHIDPNVVSGGHGLPSMNTMPCQVTKTEPIGMESFGYGRFLIYFAIVKSYFARNFVLYSHIGRQKKTQFF